MFLHHRFEFLGIDGPGPVRNYVVEFLLHGPARGVRGIALVFGQFRLAHRFGEAAEHGVLVGRNQDQLTVAGRVDIGGRDVWQDRTLTLAYIAGLVVFRDQRFHHIQNSFINGRVNNLALAGAFAMVQGG